MKTKRLTVVMLLVITVLSLFGFAACDKKNDDGNDVTTLRFAAPQGTPALAIAKLLTDNKTLSGKNIDYAIVGPSLIGAEMSAEKADLVIMPINAGASLIKGGAKYKLISVAVEGTLFLVGKSTEEKNLTIDDLRGKKIACIGENGVPGFVFRYVLSGNNLNYTVDASATLDNDTVFIKYIADGNAAQQLLENGSVDYAVVSEPAATVFKGKIGCNAKMDIQKAYADVVDIEGVDSYPQAGLFVKADLLKDTEFIHALFVALDANRKWVTANPTEVNAYMKANAYDSAAFPAASIPNCVIDCEGLDIEKREEIVSFLNRVMPKPQDAPAYDWAEASLF